MTAPPTPTNTVDVAVVGGGPAGLAAALALGRACRSVALFDAGTPRNAAATHVHNFLSRDGTPPAELRRIAREQLASYPAVQLREAAVIDISGEPDAFVLRTSAGPLSARRVVLCTGMIDESLDIPGFEAAWGHSIYQCPYCHGWEVRGRRWAHLALSEESLKHGFPALLRAWTDEVEVYTLPGLSIAPELQADLQRRGIHLAARPLVALEVDGTQLTHAVLEGGERRPCDALFAHPPQRQVPLVAGLGLELDPLGYVQADPMSRRSSRPGIYAAGDLCTRAQGAIFAAATGTQAGAMVNHELCLSA